MKFFGVKIQGPNRIIIPVLRTGMEIIFVAEGITNFEPFFAICPQPEPPKLLLPGGKYKYDVEDEGYKIRISEWANLKGAWTIVNSLRNSPGVEWESVDFAKPETWNNYRTELEEAGFTNAEIIRILTAAMEANSLNEGLIEEARQRFLASEQAQANGQSSPVEDQKITQSGEPAKDSESNPQDLKQPLTGQN